MRYFELLTRFFSDWIAVVYLNTIYSETIVADEASAIDDVLNPGFVVRHAHVDSGQVGVRALDTMRHCPHQDPATVWPT